MKNVILLHGLKGSPDNFWFAWLRAQLEGQGYRVTAPQLPDPEHPHLQAWTDYALAHLSFDAETILIGHSAGCPLALSILGKLNAPIRRCILVAGFLRLEGMKDDDVMLLPNSDWDKIKHNGHSFFFFNADNDPWGCNHLQGEVLRAHLGGTLIVQTGEGHFGSKVFDQPYDQFPLLKDICLLA